MVINRFEKTLFRFSYRMQRHLFTILFSYYIRQTPWFSAHISNTSKCFCKLCVIGETPNDDEAEISLSDKYKDLYSAAILFG